MQSCKVIQSHPYYSFTILSTPLSARSGTAQRLIHAIKTERMRTAFHSAGSFTLILDFEVPTKICNLLFLPYSAYLGATLLRLMTALIITNGGCACSF